MNLLKGQAAQLDERSSQPRLAVVKSVDQTNYTVRVAIQPEGVLSGWLPVAAQWVGAGWGLSCPPSPGDQVFVLWQEGDAEHGIVIGRLWSSVTKAPGAASGELWLQHRSGSFVKLLNDGSIASHAPNWMHTGDFHVSGNVFDHHGSLDALRGHYDVHAHPPSNTPPNPQD